jgi:glycosyltransferase involved in cell wall biosynthesis
MRETEPLIRIDNPLVTVVMPSFNHAKYIATAVESVLSQTYFNLELIVIDNYSSDDTELVLSRYKDPRLSLIKVNNGGSIAVSRNLGIQNAKGEWVAFLDSDDWWDNNKLLECSDYFEEGNDLIYHDLQAISNNLSTNDSRALRSRTLRRPVFKDLLLKGNTISTSSAVVRTSIIRDVNGMDESLEMVGIEDFNTWLRISRVSDGFKHIPKSLGFYRVHEENLSNKKQFAIPRPAFNEFLPLLSEKEVHRVESIYNYNFGRTEYLKGNLVNSKEFLVEALKHAQFEKKIKSLIMLSRILFFGTKKIK